MKSYSHLRRLFTTLVIIILVLLANQAMTQKLVPSAKGYAPVTGTKLYYEVYGQGRPLVLLHGAFYTIKMNWQALIPELSKTHKVIAIEMQGHGHSPYTE
ncbi:MAG: alpha/beta hydrolase, partial [Bacteroidota bacterium]|nr:alpha/beta hydrolase [Bacteroidota bacterium]